MQTDWEKVASVANVKTSKYARDQFAIIRKKLCGGGKAKSDTASPSRTPTKPKAAKATQPRKRKKREGQTSRDHCPIYNRTNISKQTDDDDGASQPSASADEASMPKVKKTKKSRKVKVEETEAENDGGEELAAPVVQEQQADARDVEKLEPEDDNQEESFFEAEMFHMG